MTLRGFLPAACHSISLAIALCIEHMNSPLAGAWLLFHFLGCGFLVFDGRKYGRLSDLRFIVLAWLFIIGASTFIFRPVINGASIMWVLAAMPMLMLCMKPEYLKSYLVGFGGILTLYALVLVGQFVLNVRFTDPALAYNWFVDHQLPDGTLSGFPYAASWPLIDPNNAAAVMNMGLIPSFFMALTSRRRWICLFGLFALAILFTASKAGIIAACVACAVLLVYRYGYKAALLMSPAILCIIPAWPHIMLSFAMRQPIWSAAAKILDVSPVFGVGLGMFGAYYSQVRTEHITGGWFAHNDLLQIAIEMGIPAAFLFSWQWMEVLITACRKNMVAVCTIFAVVFQSMLEFDFYLPSISLLLGLALAWYDANTKCDLA